MNPPHSSAQQKWGHGNHNGERPIFQVKVPCIIPRTVNFNTFSYGVANRGASIRIPRETERLGYGYLEDRRPSSNMDPYLVTSLLAKSILL